MRKTLLPHSKDPLAYVVSFIRRIHLVFPTLRRTSGLHFGPAASASAKSNPTDAYSRDTLVAKPSQVHSASKRRLKIAQARTFERSELIPGSVFYSFWLIRRCVRTTSYSILQVQLRMRTEMDCDQRECVPEMSRHTQRAATLSFLFDANASLFYWHKSSLAMPSKAALRSSHASVIISIHTFLYAGDVLLVQRSNPKQQMFSGRARFRNP